MNITRTQLTERLEELQAAKEEVENTLEIRKSEEAVLADMESDDDGYEDQVDKVDHAVELHHRAMDCFDNEDQQEIKDIEKALEEEWDELIEASDRAEFDYAKKKGEEKADDDGVDLSAWPYNCINWQEAAEDPYVTTDLTVVIILGTNYYAS